MISPAASPSPAVARAAAFSLIEAALAIGIVAFAFVAIFALVPTGLGMFRASMDATVCAQIAQRVLADVQEADLAALLVGAEGAGDAASPFVVLPARHFDDQGREVPPGMEQARGLYDVRVRVAKPGARDPAEHTAASFTALPTTGAPFNPRFLHLVTVQIVANPGGRNLSTCVDAASQLYSQPLFDRAGLRLPWQSYSTAVARLEAPVVNTP